MNKAGWVEILHDYSFDYLEIDHNHEIDCAIRYTGALKEIMRDAKYKEY
ncbi:MAG: hypothetical protein AABY06_00580 [Nanoarchaeota archaeon]